MQEALGTLENAKATSARGARQRSSSSSSAEAKTKKRSVPGSLVVSIDRNHVETQQKLVPGSSLRIKKNRQPEAPDPLLKKAGGSEHLTVKVPRSKLKKGPGGRAPKMEPHSVAYEDGTGFMLAEGWPDQAVSTTTGLYAGAYMCVYTMYIHRISYSFKAL